MKMLFLSPTDPLDKWRVMMGDIMPELELINWEPGLDPQDDIDYALVWKPPAGVLKTFTGLKAILSLGAGVDGIFVDPELPTHLPIVRLIDQGLTEGMSEYMIYWTLHFHRDFDVYHQRAKDKVWKQHRQAITANRRVGIMGMGELGSDAAKKLHALGFDVAGWSRSPKSIDGVESFSGDDGMIPFLERSDILICLLPLTSSTHGIINKQLLSHLPEKAVLINGARGGHVVDDDLRDVLDSGHLRAAVLDVFNIEPLPEDHYWWDHPKVTVTPHVASQTQPHSAAERIKYSIQCFEKGETPPNVVDINKGY